MGKPSVKIDVEKLFRIKYTHFKEQLKTAMKIYALPLPEEKRRLIWNLKYTMSGAFGERVLNLSFFYYKTGQEGAEEERLRFMWETPEGESRERDFLLTTAKSYLAHGTKHYFLRSLYGGGNCRTLYSDGWGIYNREELEGKVDYRGQRESKKWRALRKYQRAEEIAMQKHRHKTHKGELTPYGKQLQKALSILESPPDIMVLFAGANRGKPKKGKEGSRRK